MATITHVFSIGYVAKMLNEDSDLLRAINRNDDNLSYGNIINVVTGEDEAITALSDDGIDELSQMLADARRSANKWHDFLETFVDDQELVARIKAKPLR